MSGPTAPPAAQRRLLDLQVVDDELGRVAAHRRRLETGADVRAAEADHASRRRESAERRDVVDDLRTRITRLETDVRLVEQRMERDRARLATTASPRDAQGLEQEIASLVRRRSALEDEELELMEAAEAAEAAASEASDGAGEAERRLAGLRVDRDDALAALVAQRSSAEEARASIVADLPADLVGLYDRQRTRYGIGAARLVGAVSEGSNMALTGADLARVRAAAPDEVILDPESGCILVRTDGPA